MANNDDLDIGNQILLEKIVKFCYQGDIGCRSCVWFSSISKDDMYREVLWIQYTYMYWDWIFIINSSCIRQGMKLDRTEMTVIIMNV